MRRQASPVRRKSEELRRAIKEFKATKHGIFGNNRPTHMVVFHAVELAEMWDEIEAGKLDKFGYEIEG